MTRPQRAFSLVIRRAAQADAGTLTAIARAAKATWAYPAAWLESWRGELALTAEYIAAHLVFAADIDDATVGVSALEHRGGHWSLAHVWVAPAAQGLGVGRALVVHALDVARAAAPELPVHVESDPNAVDFYTRLGARVIGEVPAPMLDAPSRTLPLLRFDAVPRASRPEPDE